MLKLSDENDPHYLEVPTLFLFLEIQEWERTLKC